MPGRTIFPPGFLWGTAASAFQLEGSPHADWAAWDRKLDSIPLVTNHYSLFREDLALLKDLGVNAYRFSLEWSRLEPAAGAWDERAMAHYEEMIDILRSAGIEVMLTLHHFTHPRWFIENYPWHEDSCVEKFTAYVERVVAALGGVRYWITFNEPYVLLLGGYLEGCMPPGISDEKAALRALRNILLCHSRAYEIIHAARPDALVSVAHNMAAVAPWRSWNPLDRLLARISKYFYNHSLLDAFLDGFLRINLPLRRPVEMEVPIKGRLDFFGVNYYTRVHLRFNPLKKMGVELRHRDIDALGLTDMGWEIHPRGLKKVLRYASRLNVPLIITENGIATRDAHRKTDFMRRHVEVLEECLREGMDIRGYFYWSLIDNYEWLMGLDARFGLYRVDYQSFKRTPTNAAAYYSHLIKSRSCR